MAVQKRLIKGALACAFALMLSVFSWTKLKVSIDSTVVPQGDRTGLCGGIDSQNSHEVSCLDQ